MSRSHIQNGKKVEKINKTSIPLTVFGGVLPRRKIPVRRRWDVVYWCRLSRSRTQTENLVKQSHKKITTLTSDLYGYTGKKPSSGAVRRLCWGRGSKNECFPSQGPQSHCLLTHGQNRPEAGSHIEATWEMFIKRPHMRFRAVLPVAFWKSHFFCF